MSARTALPLPSDVVGSLCDLLTVALCLADRLDSGALSEGARSDTLRRLQGVIMDAGRVAWGTRELDAGCGGRMAGRD